MVRSRERHLVARRIPRRDGLLPKDRRRRDDYRRRARRTNPKSNFAAEAAGRDALARSQSDRHRGVGRVGGAQRPASQAPASCFHVTAVKENLAGSHTEDTRKAQTPTNRRRHPRWELSILPKPFPTLSRSSLLLLRR